MKRIGTMLMALLLLLIGMVSSVGEDISVSASANDIYGISSAKSYIVIDDNGKVLVGKNCDEKHEVASICKLMTSLITIENIENGNIGLDTMFVASDYACMAEGSQAFLDAGCRYSVRDLLKSVIVSSANDSAIVLAENIAGSEPAFVEQMNTKAKEIGMNNTLYANSTGLNDKNTQYSTARDTSIILNKISEFDVYKQDCKIWIDELIHPSGRKTELVNTNRLVKYYPYCVTGKTGFTDEAGYCLSSVSVKDNFKLTCVVLGCKSSADRFGDSIALYNYAYANFESRKIVSAGDVLENDIGVSRGRCDRVDVRFAEDYYLTLNKSDKSSYRIDISLPTTVPAPIEDGAVLGVAKIIVEDKEVGQIDIVAHSKVERQTYKDIVGKLFGGFSRLG